MTSRHTTRSPLKSALGPRTLPWLAIGLIALAVLWYWEESANSQRKAAAGDFEQLSEHAVELFRERYSFYANIVYATRALFHSSDEVTPTEWHGFIRALRVMQNYPGVRRVAFARYNDLGLSPSAFRQLADNRLAALAASEPQQRGFSVTVSHLEPNEDGSGMLGEDLAASAVTLEAMQLTCRQKGAILTSTIEAPAGGERLIRHVMPVYTDQAASTVNQCNEHLQGWVSIDFGVDEWLNLFAEEFPGNDFFFALRSRQGQDLFDNRPQDFASAYHARTALSMGQRDWVIDFYSTPQFELRTEDPLVHIVPIAALFATLFLMLMVRWLQGSRERAESIAANMTERLRLSEERYREMFEGNKAVELLIDPQSGEIVDANQAAVNYYGYRRDELVRMKISDINTLTPDEIAKEMRKAKEERRNHFLFKHRHATGEVRDVEVHSGPILVGGKHLLYSIVHDVTARMESEQALRESEERYHTIIDTTGEGYWLVELNTLKIIEVNEALCRMLGYSREEIIGRQPFELADEENSRIFAYQASKIRQTRQRSYEVVLQHKDGHDVIVQINATNMPHGEEEPNQAFAFITDITERKRAEEELRIAATFFETTSEAITVTDTHNRIIAINPAFTAITGYTEEEALGRDPSFLGSGRNNRAFYRNMWHTLERLGRWQGEIWNRRKNGEIYPEWLSIVAIRDDKGVVKQYMAVFSDITKRKQDEEKIWRQANYDGLTGLPNRNLFKDRLDQAMHAAHREGSRLALMFIDLDRFKWVNDTLGHASGDLLLQEAARRLQGHVRETDTVARLGGDEFTVLLNDIKGTVDVDRIAENLLGCLAEAFNLGGKEAFVTGSIGITLYPGDATDMEQLLGNADAAMYTAKEAGRNVFRYFTREMNEAAQRRLQLETDLRRVLEREELLLHYQPIIDSHGEACGAEALLRWDHPEFGAISPDEFIPLAEETGTIIPIEQWVMRQACNDAVRFKKCVSGDFFVSVNISSVQCKSDHCRMVIGSVLQESGLDPACLKLEITERVMMENTEYVIELLREVRSMGVRLAVDDFGTGYSSLSYLKQFPVDVLKIDRVFIEDLPDDRDNMALVEAIIAMAHSLNLQVVGEGVETPEQLAFLNSLGCDMIQGFHYSRPVPAQELVDFLSRHPQTDVG